MDSMLDLFTDMSQMAVTKYHELGVVYFVFVPAAVLLSTFFIAAFIVRRKRRRERQHLEHLKQELERRKSQEPEVVQSVAEVSPSEQPPEQLVKQTDEELPPPPAVPTDISDIKSVDDKTWVERLQVGLSKTRDSLSTGLAKVFTGKVKLDEDVLEDLHEQLYRADIGVKTVDRLVDGVRSKLMNSERSDLESIKTCLKTQVVDIFSSNDKPLNIPAEGPWVILVVGVNGVGKTTTIGKLTAHFLANGKSVLLGAADTYRAAAIDQLKVWGDRLGVDVVAHKAGADPAAVAYDAVKAAIARKSDVLLIDTAGRLHSKKELMDELAKIKKVIGRDLPTAPHEVWLVIDATTGQNAFMQAKAFKDVVDLTGTVVTKLDGTAKGGVVIGVSDQFGFPIRYIGVGEKAADLRNFSALDYANSLL